jgi:hypothetical protein
MPLRDDIHGTVFRDDNIKLYYPSHSWNMKALFKSKGDISIITNNIEDMEKLIEQINNSDTGNIRILCDSRAVNNAVAFKKKSPKITIRHKPSINAKIYLRSDGRIYISSENLGKTDGLGVSVGFKSVSAYNNYLKNVFEPEWASAHEI